MDYGVLTLVPILIVILIALTTRRTLEALMVGTLSTYIITDGFGFLHAWIEAFFSVATFLIVAVLNFSTGSVWGIPAMVVPILIPLAASIDANMLLVMGAIVSGATLGSHACFYSDATVLTSSCCKMENMEHALSQLPYALLATAIAAAGYLVCGLAM